MPNVWTQVTTERLIKALRAFNAPRHFHEGHMRGGPAAEVRLIRAALIERDALPAEFAAMPPHWFKGQKQS